MNYIKIFFLGTFLFSLSVANANDDLSTFLQKSDVFLNNYVDNNGMVDYEIVKNNFSTIDNLYQQIGNLDLSGASDQEKKAFYINAYNLIVIHLVAKNYPLNSPMDLSGFFDEIEHKVAGQQMTLNFLEFEKLIAPYQDARIHFVVACAAQSCPPLANFAYLPEKLDQQLERRTKQNLNDPEFIRVDHGSKQVAVSKIFDWYEEDFTQGGQTIIEYINQYRDDEIPEDYEVTYYEYDWNLNKQP